MKAAVRSAMLASVFMLAAAGPACAAAANNDAAIEGFGRDLPLSFAIRQIVPKGYKLDIRPEVDGKQLVSWTGGPHWRSVLDGLMLPRGLQASYEDHHVTIASAPAHDNVTAAAGGTGFMLVPYRGGGSVPQSPAGAIDIKQLPPAVAANPVPDVAVKPSAAPAADPPAALPVASPALQPQEIWTITAGQTVREAFEMMAQRAGWQVEWQVDFEYPVQSSASYTGDFLDAVRGILKGVKAKPGLRAYAYKENRTLVIMPLHGEAF